MAGKFGIREQSKRLKWKLRSKVKNEIMSSLRRRVAWMLSTYLQTSHVILKSDLLILGDSTSWYLYLKNWNWHSRLIGATFFFSGSSIVRLFRDWVKTAAQIMNFVKRPKPRDNCLRLHRVWFRRIIFVFYTWYTYLAISIKQGKHKSGK